MESQERARRYGLAMIVGGVSMAWFGAGSLMLSMYGWFCSLSPPVCTVSAMNYLPEILFVSVGGGLAGGGLYAWLDAVRTMERPPLLEQLATAGGGLVVIGAIGSVGTYAFLHSILFGWSPGGLFEATEDLLYFGPPVVSLLGVVLLAIGALAKPSTPPRFGLPAVKIRPKAR